MIVPTPRDIHGSVLIKGVTEGSDQGQWKARAGQVLLFWVFLSIFFSLFVLFLSLELESHSAAQAGQELLTIPLPHFPMLGS